MGLYLRILSVIVCVIACTCSLLNPLEESTLWPSAITSGEILNPDVPGVCSAGAGDVAVEAGLMSDKILLRAENSPLSGVPAGA
jgi:hypothetical protein